MEALKTLEGGGPGRDKVRITRNGVVHVEPRAIVESENGKRQIAALKRIVQSESKSRK